MIKNILYVEDGSVDVQELEKQLTKETKIIVYRQGSNRPIITPLDVPIEYAKEERQTIKRIQIQNAELRKKLDVANSYYDALHAAQDCICEKCGNYGNGVCETCCLRNDDYFIRRGKEQY